MSLAKSDVSGGADSFHATRWTLVRAAHATQATPSQSLDALSQLCRIYWRPLYLFLRRSGYGVADAQDLTQGFFADLIETRFYERADESKGRFRSFLLGALKHFVADARAREGRQKRGGGQFLEPFDEETMREIETQIDASPGSSPDLAYEREWAASLLRQTFDRLAQESALKGRSALFAALRPYLPSGGEEVVPYEQIARRLNRGLLTLRSDVSRLRARFRILLREEVRETLTDGGEVADELRYLCQVLTHAERP